VRSHFDLAVIGSGSGNTLVDARFADRDVAIVEAGTFGGTCLNVGCIPTKMLVYPADLATNAVHGPELGVDTRFDGARWREIRDRVFGRIDPISSGGRDHRLHQPNVTLVEERVRFVGDRALRTASGETFSADQVVVAAGSRPVVPPVEGLDDVPFHTSDTVMRVDDVPRRLLVLGGGYVAAELAHVFGSLGSEVTVVVRGQGLLTYHDKDVSRRFTDLVRQKWDVRLGTQIDKTEPYDGAVRAHLSDGTVVDADLLLVAAGRRSNADRLDVDRAGIRVDDTDVIEVDDFQRTSAEGVWALGDVANHSMLKHVANHEARVVQHNLLHLDDPDRWQRAMRGNIPSAVFSAPQVASVGLTEQEAVARGVPHVMAHQAYADVAYGWAMEDTTGFAKLVAEPGTGRLLGAHVIGPQASNLIQPLVQAMSLGQSAHQVARGQYWIHPALMEVVENALLQLPPGD
jgi:mycothione reductase